VLHAKRSQWPVSSHQQRLVMLAASVRAMANKAQSFTLSHDRLALSFQQVLKGDRFIDSLPDAQASRKDKDPQCRRPYRRVWATTFSGRASAQTNPQRHASCGSCLLQ
jgi:hypothetical protein